MLVWPAPAKINLFLNITARRADGYHELQTLFQLLDWGDSLSFELVDEPAVTQARPIPGVVPASDLCVRAAILLRQATEYSGGVRIHLDKRIPLGAGLGGGSSDAATTLVALNWLWKTHLSKGELCELARQVGADVPVFVGGESAWAEGVGEILTPLSLPARWYLVLYPQVKVSTAEIFNASELTRSAKPIRITDFLAGQGVNLCEPVVVARYPEVGRALTWLRAQGDAFLTGTGSSLFVGFSERAAAEALASEVPRPWQAIVARGVNRSPLQTVLERLRAT